VALATGHHGGLLAARVYLYYRFKRPLALTGIEEVTDD
jgi:hypothetical protein